MTEQYKRWLASMRIKLNVETDEEVKEWARNNIKKSKGNVNGVGGFGSRTQEERREIAMKGVRARAAKRQEEHEG